MTARRLGVLHYKSDFVLFRIGQSFRRHAARGDWCMCQRSASSYDRAHASAIFEGKDKRRLTFSEGGLRGRCQRGGRRLLCLCNSLPPPLCDLRTLLRDEHGRAPVPLIGPVSEVSKGEHRNDVTTRIWSTRKRDGDKQQKSAQHAWAIGGRGMRTFE